MIGYLFCDVLQIAGGVSMCYGVKRLFTVHGLHRLPRWAFRRRPRRHLRRYGIQDRSALPVYVVNQPPQY